VHSSCECAATAYARPDFWDHLTQAEAKVLAENGPNLANKTFIDVPDSATANQDANSAAGTPTDTPSVTPTKHLSKVRISFMAWLSMVTLTTSGHLVAFLQHLNLDCAVT
jgi:ABC-type transport system substrate-binding protein